MPPKAIDKGKPPANPSGDTLGLAPPQENPLFLPSGLDDLSSSGSSDELDEPSRTEIISPVIVDVPVIVNVPINVSDDESDDDTSDWLADPDNDNDDNNDDDDPVVCSYDIHITASTAPDLYIFQYPVRSKTKPYTKAENTCPLEARFKPKSGLVEVDVPVNVHVNYDEEKGRAWGDILRKAEKEKGKTLGGAGGGAAQGNKRRKVARGEDDESEEEEVDVMMMDFADALKAGRVLSRQTLGSKMQPDNTKYMVGIFKNGALSQGPDNCGPSFE